jgi:hypothetical protein
MNLAYDGLSIRYDTPDAPAPTGRVADTSTISLTVGVEPPNPGNAVDVRYRVDGGPFRTLVARENQTDYSRGVQYFSAKFPINIPGKKIEYYVVATCAGRQVPAYGHELDELASFTLVKEEAPVSATEPPRGGIVPRFDPSLTFIAQVTVPLKPPVIIGKTPVGFRIDYYALPGTCRGDLVSATVMENSADYMIVRPDGIGHIDVHATLLTDDGATITSAYSGTIDFGADGYARMVRGDYPKLPPLQINPRLMTTHPRYEWVNRTHFLGVGNVDMQELVLRYDVYTVKTLIASKRERGP